MGSVEMNSRDSSSVTFSDDEFFQFHESADVIPLADPSGCPREAQKPKIGGDLYKFPRWNAEVLERSGTSLIIIVIA